MGADELQPVLEPPSSLMRAEDAANREVLIPREGSHKTLQISKVADLLCFYPRYFMTLWG